MKITKAQVQLSEGPDHVVLWTDTPAPLLCSNQLWSNMSYSDAFLTLSFTAPANTGVDYVKKFFNVNPEIVDRRRQLGK